MLLRKRLFLTLCLFGTLVPAIGQRSYKSHSVLASGNWYQLSVTAAGVYKLDLAFLNKLGLSTANLTQSGQLFGNGGQMLTEANNGQWLDDLQENAIMVIDGGDGILNGSDHILFSILPASI